MEDWAEIRRLHRAEEMPIRAIARQLGISKNTVKRALATDRPPVYPRPPKGSAVDAVEPQIRELLKQTPTMPATVIAERIGWERGMTILKDRVRELRPAYLPVDPVSRTIYQPGELAQCDLWFPPVDIPLGYGQTGRPPVLVMVSGYSRVIAARMLPSRQDRRPDRRALAAAARGWQAVPRMLVWDNEARYRRGAKLTERVRRVRAGCSRIKVHPLPAPRSGSEGPGRAGQRLPGDVFLPGRTFTGPDDFNTQLAELAARSPTGASPHPGRAVRPTGGRPTGPRCSPCPPVDPPRWWRFATRIGRGPLHPRRHLRLLRPPLGDRQRVEVPADLHRGIMVTLRRRGSSPAMPACWARHQTITDPEHAAGRRRLRGECRHQQAARAATPRPPPADLVEVEQRELGTYDRVFTLIEGDGGTRRRT